MSNLAEDVTLSIDTDKKTIFVDLNKEIYHRDAVLKASNKFTNHFYVKVAPSGEYCVRVTFEVKPDNEVELEFAAKSFCNEVLDQQIREDLNKTNGHIRKIIYEHAFAPIKDLEGTLEEKQQ
jgi:His-Xaa-Ser system protein HxsD